MKPLKVMSYYDNYTIIVKIDNTRNVMRNAQRRENIQREKDTRAGFWRY